MSIKDWWRRNFGSPVVEHSNSRQGEPTTTPTRNPDMVLLEMVDSGDIDTCIKAYTSATSGSRIESLAVSKIKKLARTFKDWQDVCVSVSPVSSLGKYASEQLLVTAQCFEDWRWIYTFTDNNFARIAALDKMASIAHTLEAQAVVYEIAPSDSPIKASMIAAIKSQAKTTRDWQQIAESSKGELKKLAVDMLIELTPKTLSDLDGLFSCEVIADNRDLSEKVIGAIKALDIPIAEWIDAISDEDLSDETRDIAVDKVAAHPEADALGFEQWKKILDGAEEDSDFERHAAERVILLAPTNDPKILVDLILDNSAIGDDSELEDMAIDKLRAMSEVDFTVWKEVYGYTDEDSIKSVARDMMIARIDSAEELVDAYETLDDEDEGEEWAERFASKATAVLCTESQCRQIFEGYYADSIMFSAALRKLLSLATTTEKCLEIFLALIDEWQTEDGDSEEDLLTAALEKLLSVATQSELYIMARLGDEFGDLGSEATKRLEKDKNS